MHYIFRIVDLQDKAQSNRRVEPPRKGKEMTLRTRFLWNVIIMSGHFNDYTTSDSPTPSFVTDPAYATVVVPALAARDAKLCDIARRRAKEKS